MDIPAFLYEIKGDIRMTLYQAMQQNLNEGMIGVHPTIQSLAKELGITKQFNYDDFLATLGCFCDFTASKEGKAVRVEIHEIDEQPLADFHNTIRGDYSKLKCKVEERERASVYIIYSKEHDMVYVGSTLCLKSRYSYWKCVSAKGSQEAGARVFRLEDSMMMPLLIANSEDICNFLRLSTDKKNMRKLKKELMSIHVECDGRMTHLINEVIFSSSTSSKQRFVFNPYVVTSISQKEEINQIMQSLFVE